MDEIRRNTLVGAFMVVGLGAMAWLMTSFGELPALFGAVEHDLVILVENPRGIGEGTPIFLSGVQIGRVKGLRFKDRLHPDAGVEIIGAVKEKYVIPSTATAVVQPSGMGLGRGRIDLTVPEGTATPLEKGGEIHGTMGSPWGDMIPDTLLESVDKSAVQFGNFVESLAPVAADLHALLKIHPTESVDAPTSDSQRLTANISTVVERFDRTLKMFNDTFGDPTVREGWLNLIANIEKVGNDALETLENIKNASAELRASLQSISVKLEAGIVDTHERINEIAGEMRPVLQNTARLTALLMRIADAMQRGEGSAGMFVRDPRLYESLLMTSERLAELTDTIHRIFRKFELEGAIKVDFPTLLGPRRGSIEIPEAPR
ncbi:MAG: hypothetical protein IID43_00590 [Planctomycetes bacterium]|nr:hypothetical protein [Planctomycetota bacterium]